MRYQVLDSWRGIAALLVALFHFRVLGHFYEWSFVRHGWLWVDFFFVLSGFVITHAYGHRLGSFPEAASFAIRRVGRLWPLHIALLAAFFALESVKWALLTSGAIEDAVPAFASGETYSPAALLTNLFLIHSLGVHEILTWNTPSWSISTELYVCVAFAIACLLPARLFRITIGAAIVGSFWLVAQSGSYLNTTYDYGFFRCALGFLVGHLTYRAHRTWSMRASSGGSFHEFVVLGAALLFVSGAGNGPATLAAPFVFSAAVFIFSAERGRISTWLRARPFQKLGEWSYSVYMVHMLVFVIFSRAMLVAERTMDTSLRVPYGDLQETTVIDVFFFRTNLRWTSWRWAT